MEFTGAVSINGNGLNKELGQACTCSLLTLNVSEFLSFFYVLSLRGLETGSGNRLLFYFFLNKFC